MNMLRNYAVITGAYWAFTLTDGAIRMLVVLYFHQLGYTPLAIASLFLFYEFFGMITNLIGGWAATRFGLKSTLLLGMALQIIALLMLTVPVEYLTILYVMAAQALSGIAKDLNKMSAKSSIKQLFPADAKGASNKLFKWIAILTGSKNTLKGIGFFLGGLLLTWLGFAGAIAVMVIMLIMVWLFSMIKLQADLGKAKNKPKFNHIFSKSRAINLLSAARLFLFAARDIWFVIALPVFLAAEFSWSHSWVSGFIAAWIVLYGLMQTLAPKLTRKPSGQAPSSKDAAKWGAILVLVPLAMALLLYYGVAAQWVIIIGLIAFALLFAINSSLHSFLIVDMADKDGVSLDVGFYYMANACGRLLGTILSGWIFQVYGLVVCLFISAIFITFAVFFAALINPLKKHAPEQTQYQ